MSVSRFALLGTVALLVATLPASAQRVQIQPKRIGVSAPVALLSPAAVEKLKLTPEQAAAYTKTEAEYRDKMKAAQDKFRDDIKGLNDREKSRDVNEKFQAEQKKLRDDHLAKVEQTLTAEQKTVLTQVRVQPVQPGGIIIRPQPIGGAPGIGQILPPVIQQQLQLTDEQKKQIDAIQKEVEAKIMKVLTDEQRKQLETMKKGAIVRPVPIRPVQPNPQIQPRVPNIQPVPNPRQD